MAALMNTRKAAFGQRVRASPARNLVVRRVASGEPEAAGNPEVIEYIKTLPGISAPFDSPYFDPAGLSKTARTVAEVRRWRESELVHGRVAMLAALGFIIGEQLEDFPVFFNADGHITGPAIYQFQQVEARGGVFWEPLVFAIGLAESYRVGVAWATPKGTAFNTLKGEDEYTLGDLGFDPLGLKPTDPAALKELETKELNNGRLAMIAIAAFTAEELVSHQEIFEHLALRLEKEAILELDDVERDVGAPVTSVPALVIEELSK